MDCFYYKKKNETNVNYEKLQKPKSGEIRNIKEEEKHFPTIRYNAHVNKEKFSCFLDSGSNISLMSTLSFKRLNTYMTTLKSVKIVKTANNTDLEIIGYANLEIQFEENLDYKFKQKVYISNEVEENEILLGIDFLKTHRCIIDLENNIFSIADLKISIPGAEKRKNSQVNLKDKYKCFSQKGVISNINTEIENYKKINPEVGDIPNIEHDIKLSKNLIINKRPYPVPFKLVDKTKEKLQELLKQNIIRKSNSEFSSQAFVKPKPNGDVRIIIDYRPLNEITIKTGHPFPTIWDQLNQLHGKTIFSQIDLNSGYYQIKMKDSAISKTAFSLSGGHYEFLKMPLGLTEAPKTFTRAMNTLFEGQKNFFIFMDDILVASENLAQHYEDLKILFKIFNKNNISVNFSKSEFLKERVNYLGMEITAEGIKVGDKGLKSLEKILIPKTKKDLQRLLGIINWFRPFIRNLSQKLSEITDLLKEKVFVWQKKHQEIIDKIKAEIKEKTLIYHVDYNKPFELFCDASDYGIGGVLIQEGNIVGMYSNKFNSAEKHYTTTEKEGLAVIKTLKYFKPVVFGSKIIVFTDHLNLSYIHKSTSPKIQRWRIFLEEFNIQIKHVKGNENTFPDMLSRDACMKAVSQEISYCFPPSKENIIKIQKKIYK